MPDHEFCYPHVVPAVAEAEAEVGASASNAREPTPLSHPETAAASGAAPTRRTVSTARDDA
jgi:hypothetical protein